MLEKEWLFIDRTMRRALSVTVAAPCFLAAAYLAIDWADYGQDSTCGNFIRRAPWTGVCSETMWHRTFAIIGLVVFAGMLMLLAWLRRDAQPSHSAYRI